MMPLSETARFSQLKNKKMNNPIKEGRELSAKDGVKIYQSTMNSAQLAEAVQNAKRNKNSFIGQTEFVNQKLSTFTGHKAGFMDAGSAAIIANAGADAVAAGNTGIAGTTPKVSTGTKIANTASTIGSILGGILGTSSVASGSAGGVDYSASLGGEPAPAKKILGMSPVLFYTILVVLVLAIVFFVVRANKK